MPVGYCVGYQNDRLKCDAVILVTSHHYFF